MRPPNVGVHNRGLTEGFTNAVSGGGRATSRKHPLRVTERTENVRGGLIQKRAAPLCVVNGANEDGDAEATGAEEAPPFVADVAGGSGSDKENGDAAPKAAEKVIELELEPEPEPETGVSTAIASVGNSDDARSRAVQAPVQEARQAPR